MNHPEKAAFDLRFTPTPAWSPGVGETLTRLVEAPEARPVTAPTDLTWRAEMANLLTNLEGELAAVPSRSLFDELREIKPAMECRFHQLEDEHARLGAEIRELRARLECVSVYKQTIVRSWTGLSRWLGAIKRAEVKALLDTYMTDTGGEG